MRGATAWNNRAQEGDGECFKQSGQESFDWEDNIWAKTWRTRESKTCRYAEKNNARHKEPHTPRVPAVSFSGTPWERQGSQCGQRRVSEPVGDKARGRVVPMHTSSAGPCKISGFYSNTVSIGRFWTGEWVNLHVSMISVAAAHSQGIRGRAGGQPGGNCCDLGKKWQWLRPKWWDAMRSWTYFESRPNGICCWIGCGKWEREQSRRNSRI